MSAPRQLEPATSATPCLDRQIPFPPRVATGTYLKWWQIVLVVAVMSIKTVFVLSATLIFLILIHEIGHLVGALLVGFEFTSIRVGPIEADSSGRVSLYRGWRTLANGMTKAGPRSQSALRWRYCAYIASGPAANLLVALCASKLVPSGNSTVAAMGAVVFLGSAFMGFANLIPVRVRGEMTDGLKLWTMLFTKKRRDRMLLLLGFLAKAKTGDSKGLLTDDVIEPSSQIKDGSEQQLAVNWIAYFKAEKAGDHALAARYLENSLLAAGSASAETREELTISAAQYQAGRRNRPDLASQWLEQEDSGRPNFGRKYAEALIHYQEKQYDLAETKLEEGLLLVHEMPHGEGRASSEQTIMEFKNTLRKCLVGPSP